MIHYSKNNPIRGGGLTNQVKVILKLVLTISLAIISITTTLTQAIPAVEAASNSDIESINTDNNQELKSIINNLQAVDPQKPTITKLQKKNKGEITTDAKGKLQGSSTLSISIKSNKTISMDNGRNKINIKVDNHGENSTSDTKLVDNKVIYQGAKVDTIVEALDGGIRQTINIKDSTAPKSYNFPMELQVGQRIIVNKDGSANVVNSKNESITTILKPWARDAGSNELPTHYRVDNNILKQHITTDNMTKYPVKADPTWCGNFWNEVGWVTENDVYKNNRYNKIIKVVPSWCLDAISKAQSQIANPWLAWDAWKELTDRLPWSSEWSDRSYGTDKYWSIHNQMACHITWVKWANSLGYSADYLRRKNPIYRSSYHLEAYRKNIGYWELFPYGCNNN
jgi:hypothetical protein